MTKAIGWNEKIAEMNRQEQRLMETELRWFLAEKVEEALQEFDAPYHARFQNIQAALNFIATTLDASHPALITNGTLKKLAKQARFAIAECQAIAGSQYWVGQNAGHKGKAGDAVD